MKRLLLASVLRRPAVVVTTVAVLFGCSLGISCGGGGDDRRETLERSFALWASQGLQSYRFGIVRDCFCLFTGHRFEVAVEDNRVVSAFDIDTGQPVADAAALFSTIDQYFDELRSVLDQGPNVYRVSFDSERGYPRSAVLDPEREAVDEEVSYQIELIDSGERCGPRTCDAGQVCCNASCGICTEPDGACIELFCEQN